MKLSTRHFGEVEVDESEIISFSEGLLGFEDIKRYIIINNQDNEVPFNWLQSVDEPNLAFVITNPFIFVDNYEFNIPDKVVKSLELEKHEDLNIYSIVVVPESIENVTINLKGPVIVNRKSGKAKQVVLENDKYNLKHKIFDNVKRTV